MNPPLKPGCKFDFQRDLIKTNGLLQSVVTDMRYHCEVYKLSLRSINRALKQLKEGQTTDRSTFGSGALKYTARANYQRDIILVSQNQAIEKINSILRKTRTFINGYSLLEKAEIVPVEIPKFDSKPDCQNYNCILSTSRSQTQGTQTETVGQDWLSPPEKKKSPETCLIETTLRDKRIISKVVKKKKGTIRVSVPVAKTAKSVKKHKDILRQEIRLQKKQESVRKGESSSGNKKVKLRKTTRFHDPPVSKVRSKSKTGSISSSAAAKKPTKQKSSRSSGLHHGLNTGTKERKTGSRLITKEGLTRQEIRPSRSKESSSRESVRSQTTLKKIGHSKTSKTESTVRGETSCNKIDHGISSKPSKTETVQTRRVTRYNNNKYPGIWNWKGSRYHNNNINHNKNNYKSKQQNPNPGMHSIKHWYPQGGLIVKKSTNQTDTNVNRREKFHSSDASFHHQMHQNLYHQNQHQQNNHHDNFKNEGKVRRVDIDPQPNHITTNNMFESVQIGRREKFRRYRRTDYVHPIPNGCYANPMSVFDRSNNVVVPLPISSMAEKTPLQNSQITTTLIPIDISNPPVFLEDPRLAKRKKIEMLKSMETKSTGIH